MKPVFIFGILAVSVWLVSCEKGNGSGPDIFDTIKPLEYFPAYPGSFWVYDSNDTLRADTYEIYVYNIAGYDAEPVYDTLVLPRLVLNGVFNPGDAYAYVKGYSITKPGMSSYRDPPFKELLSLTEGAEFIIGGESFGHRIAGRTVKVDTVIHIGTTIYENVIMTIHFDYACVSSTGGTPEECATLREYYARDVGLIKRERRNHPLEAEFVKDIELVEFSINRSLP